WWSRDSVLFFFFQAEDGIRAFHVTGVQTCALPISRETLDQARQAQEEGDEELAARLAERAAIDADYAAAVAQNEELQEAVQELRSEERRVGKECGCRGAPHHE